jgi:hypothetical protein
MLLMPLLRAALNTAHTRARRGGLDRRLGSNRRADDVNNQTRGLSARRLRLLDAATYLFTQRRYSFAPQVDDAILFFLFFLSSLIYMYASYCAQQQPRQHAGLI